jgi:YD repeat-containing protein
MLFFATQKDIPWRPDWGISIPPDAFTLTVGKPASITLVLEEQEYRACWKNGSLVEFPVWLQGSFAQVQGVLKDAKTIKSLTLMRDVAWQLERIGHEDPYRFVARLTGGEQVYFLAFQSDPTGISETWYDPEGNALGFFSSHYRYAGDDRRIKSLVRYTEGDASSEWYEYDSFGNVSEIVTTQGSFSALYYQKNHQKSYPRYWERPVLADTPQGTVGEEPITNEAMQQYTLQWDERGFLVGMFPRSDAHRETAVAFRYEYTLDRRGNWTERQEIRMIRRLGVLVPSPGLTIKRRITYEPGA